MKKYYEFRTQEELEVIEYALFHEGFEVVGGKRASFAEIKNNYRRNKVFAIVAYYNTLNHKYEYIYGTKQLLKK